MIVRDTNVQRALGARRAQRGFILNPYRFRVADPHFANVSLLGHFNGVNGSTTFIDSSSNPKTLTGAGSPQISTAQSKFGGASLALNGTTGYVRTNAHADFNMGTGDFTVELWVRWNDTTGRQGILAQANSAGQNTSISFLIEKTAGHVINAFAVNGGTTIGQVTGATTVSTGQWYHIAFVRNGTTFTLYLQGVSQGTASSAAALNSSINQLALGRLGEFNGLYHNGWLDEVRITKGVARYTGAFSPPTTEFLNQ